MVNVTKLHIHHLKGKQAFKTVAALVVTVSHLLPFVVVSDTLSTVDFCKAINIAHSNIICRRTNVFKLPRGTVEHTFLDKLTRLFRAFNDRSSLEKCAIKAVTAFPAWLSAPETTFQVKEKDHRRVLERRINQLKADRDVLGLVNESEIIQNIFLVS